MSVPFEMSESEAQAEFDMVFGVCPFFPAPQTCPECGGRGKRDDETCQECGGSGATKFDRRGEKEKRVMSDTEFDPIDGIHVLRTIIAHRDHVRSGLQSLTHELEKRALRHDLSKLSPEEFPAFARINRAAREHPYGSAEYRAGLGAERSAVALHYSRNSHHPEAHEVEHWAQNQGFWKAEMMGFLDLIEMVIDWRAAWRTYGTQGTWRENVDRQRERYAEWFSESQWWLIGQVARWLAEQDRDGKSE